jgi:membrane protein required for colicin V production
MLIDIIGLVLLVLAIYKGWSKGLVMALFVFVSYFIALALAFQFSGMVADYWSERSGEKSRWLGTASFILVMLAGIIAVRLIGKLIEKSIELILLGWANRLAGIVFFLLIYITVYAVVLVYLERFEFIGNTDHVQSFPYLRKWGLGVIEIFQEWMPGLKDLFKQTFQNFKQEG